MWTHPCVAYCRSRFLVLMCLGAWRETTCALSVTCCPTQSDLTLDKFNVVGISTLSKVAEHSSTQCLDQSECPQNGTLYQSWTSSASLDWYFGWCHGTSSDELARSTLLWLFSILSETGIQTGTHCYWQGKHHEDILQVPLLSHLYVQQF